MTTIAQWLDMEELDEVSEMYREERYAPKQQLNLIDIGELNVGRLAKRIHRDYINTDLESLTLEACLKQYNGHADIIIRKAFAKAYKMEYSL